MISPTLHALQQEFTRHIRDPAAHPVPHGVETRRMRIYNELIYNNIEGFIASGFPVLRSLHDDSEWHALVRAFVARHQCHTPLFLEIGEEFMGFLRDDPEVQQNLPPFAQELAHYECVELALDVDEQDIDTAGVDPDGDLLSGVPLLSGLAAPLTYRYPVHRISRQFRPAHAGSEPTCLVAYRNRADQVNFLEVNTVTMRMLELLRDATRSGAAIADCIAAELARDDVPAVRAGAVQTLEHLRRLDIVLGTRLGS